MNNSQKKTFPVFVSSLCQRANLKDLRARIYDDIGKKTYVYIDEQFKHRNIERQKDLEAADELISRVREANTFICILGGTSHGSSIKVYEYDSKVSFFEIELFQAALLEKKIHVFVRNDFTPEPKLESLLGILKFAFPEWRNIKRQNEREILSGVERVVDQALHHQTSELWFKLRAPINRLVQAFYTARAITPVFFMNNAIELRNEQPRLEILRPLVTDIEQQPNEEKRLSRLWLGLRELMAYSYENIRDEELLRYWNQLLSEWARAGAWYGLHADTPLGCLAALNSLTRVRQRLVTLKPEISESDDNAFPGGSLASSKYSIAKRLYIKSDRETRFKEALHDLQRSLEIPGSDQSGLLAIRGSIFRQMGRISECIKDYEEVLRIRIQTHAPVSQIGDALSELGFGYLRDFSPRKGLRFCQEGVEMLRQESQAGFLVRGLRKLAIAYIMNGRLNKAYELFQEARSIAVKCGAFDQL
jgi:tetratricopeptide (TPR) repeat protein